MKIFTAFAFHAGDWEMDEGKIVIHRGDESTQEFVIGTYSSMKKLRAAVDAFLPKYKVAQAEHFDGDEKQEALENEMIGKYGTSDPLVLITAWKTELDGEPGEGSFVADIRNRDQLVYPYR